MKIFLPCLFALLALSDVHAFQFSQDGSITGTPSFCKEDHIKVISSNCSEMLDYINQFPTDEYEITTVRTNTRPWHFYIDSAYMISKQDYIKRTLTYGYTWEDHITRILARYARLGSKVLDIGAHIGVHTLTMSQCVGPDGEVLAFEPQPKIFRELFQNISLNKLTNVSCYWAAVGSRNGTIEIPFLIPYNEGGTSLVTTHISHDHWSYNIIGGTGVYVDLVTIDSLNLDNISLMKIDVESMENAVLDGARETILRNKPVIIIELLGGANAEYGSRHLREQLEFSKNKIKQLGYELVRIYEEDYLALPL